MYSRLMNLGLVIGVFSPLVIAQSPEPLKPQVYQLSPGKDLQYRLQELLILAIPGDVIQFSEGKFVLDRQIDISADNITLRGQGPDKTILSFKGQRSGSQGLEATGNNFVIESLAVEDTAGNAIKVLGSRNVTIRDVRVEWTGKPNSSNGAYGLYPVQCRNVLIDSCTSIGASDAGIYVGQSRQVVVRHCLAERNVAGIEIENTIDADVHDNVAKNNAGGLLVFDLPGLQQKSGRDVRAFRNQLIGNNHPNFATRGSIVAKVPSGTGLMIMATDRVEVFDNEIRNNQTANVAIVSYFITDKRIQDPTYDPISESISIHDNRISEGGKKPSGELGIMLGLVLGKSVPDILFDGMVDSEKLVDGELPEDLRLSILNNGEATFANFNLAELDMKKIFQGKHKTFRDLAPYATSLPRIAETKLKEHAPPATNPDKTVSVYRSAPRRLSELGLFEGDGSDQKPAPGVVPYTLNTILFSDYATKHRFMFIPEGTTIRYAEQGSLEFPEGTVIAKSFGYPLDQADPDQGLRLLETRIELLRDGEWYGYSYRWNEEQTDATLILGGGDVEVTWTDQDGNKTDFRYEIPNANQCLNCHSQDKAYVPIGTIATNMNRDFDFPEGTANQLEYLAAQQMLVGLPAPEKRDVMPVAYEPQTGSVEHRARAWLHVNCAHCHSPLGTGRTSGLDLRLTQSDPGKLGIWKSPVAAGHGTGGRLYDIVPGEPDQSILLYRLQSQDPSIRMPSVNRNLVPQEAVELIKDWITAMPTEK